MSGVGPLPWWRTDPGEGYEHWLNPAMVIRLRVDALGGTPAVWGITAVLSPTSEFRTLGDYDSEADANAAARLLLIGQVPADWLT